MAKVKRIRMYEFTGEWEHLYDENGQVCGIRNFKRLTRAGRTIITAAVMLVAAILLILAGMLFSHFSAPADADACEVETATVEKVVEATEPEVTANPENEPESELESADESEQNDGPAKWAVPVFDGDTGEMHWSDGTPIERRIYATDADFMRFVERIDESGAYKGCKFEDMGNGVVKVIPTEEYYDAMKALDCEWVYAGETYIPYGPILTYDTMFYADKRMIIESTAMYRPTKELAKESVTTSCNFFGMTKTEVSYEFTGKTYKGNSMNDDPMYVG